MNIQVAEKKIKLVGDPRSFFISDLADWIPKGDPEYDITLAENVQKLTDEKFKDITTRLLLFFVNEAFRSEIRLALNSRALYHLNQFKNEIHTLGHGAFAIEDSPVSKIIEKSYRLIGGAIADFSHNPNETWLKDFGYRKTFDRIAQYRECDPGFSKTALRSMIRFNAYDGMGDVKTLFEMRFLDKSKVVDAYWSCIRDNVLSDPELALFLRGSKNTSVDYKEFEDARRRFMDDYLE